MIFEKGWFLHKMNKYAPRGYKFVAIGNDNRIAMQSNEIMGDQKPQGPFVSNISFELLDMVYGGLLTKRGGHINQGSALGEYMLSFDTARLPIKPTDDKDTEHLNGKYLSYQTIVREHSTQLTHIRPIMIRKNALLIQGLLDAKSSLPQHLAERLNKHVNRCVWQTIEKVFNNILICDIKYYQDEYRKKMQQLGIEYDKKSGVVTNEDKSRAKRYEQLSVKLEKLKYDILPRHQKSLTRAESKTPENEIAQARAKERIAQTQAEIDTVKTEQGLLAEPTTNQPARDILYDAFHSHGQPVIPQIAKNPIGQFVYLMQLRERKVKAK
ncbi:MAG: hypothetical protein IJX89_05080 [Alphaproteobacteria bacterium]|nr:hypothetical protein [Alphaproteobacteria bacterium]